MYPPHPKNPVGVASAGGARKRDLKVISRRPLEHAFEIALERSVKRHAPRLTAAIVERIREDAFRDFMQLVSRKVKNVRGVPKSEFLAELERSRNQVLAKRDQARLELERLQLRAEVFRRLKEDDEVIAAPRADNDQQIQLYQRRIAKLNASLERSELTINELARLKSVDPGMTSVYREVQGLSPHDQLWAVKNELLIQIFEANLALRDGI